VGAFGWGGFLGCGGGGFEDEVAVGAEGLGEVVGGEKVANVVGVVGGIGEDKVEVLLVGFEEAGDVFLDKAGGEFGGGDVVLDGLGGAAGVVDEDGLSRATGERFESQSAAASEEVENAGVFKDGVEDAEERFTDAVGGGAGEFRGDLEGSSLNGAGDDAHGRRVKNEERRIKNQELVMSYKRTDLGGFLALSMGELC